MTSKELAFEIAKQLSAKLALDIKIVDISSMSDVADYFVVCSGRSVPQVKSLCNYLEEAMEKQGVFAKRKEGYVEGRWVALDYQDVVVHLFHKDTREIYSLDVLWANGANVTVFED